MKLRAIGWLLLAAIMMGACAPVGAPTGAPAITPTTPSVTPGTSSLTSPVPGGGLSTRPNAEVWASAPEAALQARGDLTRRLGIDPDTIGLVSAEQIDWPDACMGIQTPGVMCAMVVTPGYRVILEAGGRQYEYHTNLSGDVVRLVQ